MVNISDWDASEYLDDEDTMIEYLNAAAQTGDPKMLQIALGDVAKARGMAQVARDAGVGRESLYKSLSSNGNPSFSTIIKIVRSLGGRITIEPAAV